MHAHDHHCPLSPPSLDLPDEHFLVSDLWLANRYLILHILVAASLFTLIGNSAPAGFVGQPGHRLGRNLPVLVMVLVALSVLNSVGGVTWSNRRALVLVLSRLQCNATTKSRAFSIYLVYIAYFLPLLAPPRPLRKATKSDLVRIGLAGLAIRSVPSCVLGSCRPLQFQFLSSYPTCQPADKQASPASEGQETLLPLVIKVKFGSTARCLQPARSGSVELRDGR
jgi:hypothetical protein